MSAKQVPVTSPTYPVPTIAIFIVKYISQTRECPELIIGIFFSVVSAIAVIAVSLGVI